MNTIKNLLSKLIFPIVIIVTWQLTSYLIDLREQTPIPSTIFATTWDLIFNGSLLKATFISLGRIITGFLIAALIALPIGLLMGESRLIDRQLSPLVESFRPIAPIALLPLSILWFGPGTPAAIFLISWAAFFPLIVNTIAGVREVDNNLVLSAKTMGLGPFHIFSKVIIQGALPRIIIGSRISLGIAWAAVIAAELAVSSQSGDGASGGIGQMMFIFYAFSTDMNSIIATMIMVGIFGYLLDMLLRTVGQKLVVWKTI